MEDQSVPETPLPEQPDGHQRPGFMDLFMGISIFMLVFLSIVTVQVVVFIQQLMARTPDLQGRSFTFDLLEESGFQHRFTELSTNGDVTSWAAIWSSLVGILLILLCTWYWKRRNTVAFLGIRSARPIMVLKWLVFFIAFSFILEGLSYLVPALQSDLMDKILASSTNHILLVLAMGVVGPLFEELLVRGLLFGSLRQVADLHTSVAITAGLFTIMHMQYDWQVLLMQVLPMGIVLGYARANGRSILVSLVPHMANNLLAIALPHLW